MATAASRSSSVRQVLRRSRGQATSDGAGVRLTRVIGTAALDAFDPFLMLDEFRSDDPNHYIAGFPQSPPPRLRDRDLLRAGKM